MLKEFAGGAKQTRLTGSLTSSATSFTVDDATGYPTGATAPFVVCLDIGLSSEEKVLCASRTGNTFTVTTRGYDGTTAQAHTATSTVDHVLDAVTVAEANTFANSGGTVTTASAASKGLVVKGSASQTANLQEWQNSAGTVMARVFSNGGIDAYGLSANVEAPTRVGLIVRGAASQTANLQEWQASDGAIRAFMNPDGGLTVGPNGVGSFGSAFGTNPLASVVMAVGTAFPGNKGLVVRGAASQSANLAEFQNSAGSVLAGFSATGKLMFTATDSTSATAGGASALPGAPVGYVTISINGADRKIPYWNP